ncbi:MAG: transglycosylase SLT domain-containing protein [Proteobacteria bacterium]|nr:transglycosylase SLT domain-containing protein [Pseudomonadota bacterium]
MNLPAAPQRMLLTALAVLLSCAASSALAADEFATQRESFAKVLKAQSSNRYTLARQLVVGLEEYPLYPYFRYNDLRRRLHRLPEGDVAQFLSAYDNSYLAERLRLEWLRQLARSKRWAMFLRFYRPQTGTKLRCLHLSARIKTGALEGVLADANALWLTGKSQPDECDLAFERLYASDLMDDGLLLQRIRLAMENGKSSLARYLASKLVHKRNQQRYALWSTAHQNPLRVLRDRQLDDVTETREILIYALQRLARKRVDTALLAWQDVSSRYSFGERESGLAARTLAIAAARREHEGRIELLDAVPQHQVDADVERYRLREGIAEKAWEWLGRWTQSEPISDVNRLRWRYWRSRALEELGRTEEATAILRGLAKERDYYGFLAADKLDLDYSLNFNPISASASEQSEMLAMPGVRRALELFLLNRRFQARREWIHELSRMDKRHQEVAATLAADWGWHDRAIFSLGKAESYDDLYVRFPILYEDIAADYAARRGLALARILAIIRSESAFMADARSGAGALGLMQILPRTARETAKRLGMRFESAKILYQPRKNIAIGTAYFKQMLDRYDGNFAMAAAAYNAGPNRVRQWRRDSCITAERWIDMIPFTETRRYVRRALFYTAVYEWRLEKERTKLKTIMFPVPAKRASSTAECTT